MAHQGRECGSTPSPCTSLSNPEFAGRRRWADFSDDEVIFVAPSPPPPRPLHVPQDECSRSDCPPSPCSTAAISVDFADRRRWADFSSDEELDVIDQRRSPVEDQGNGDFASSPCLSVILPRGTLGANDAEGAEEIHSSQVEPVSTPPARSRSEFVRAIRKQGIQHVGSSVAEWQNGTWKKKSKTDTHSPGAQNDNAENVLLISNSRPLDKTSQVDNSMSDDGGRWSVAKGKHNRVKTDLNHRWSQQQTQGDRSFWSASTTTWWTSGNGSRNSAASTAPRPVGSRSKHVTRYQERSRGATQCQFFIGIEEDAQFSVVRKVLGSHGANVKCIAEKTGAKLRLRGLGSGFLEGPDNDKKESSDPLMLCVSAPDVAAYELTKMMVIELLEKVYDQHREHCRLSGSEPLGVHVNFHEGYRPGAR